MLIAIQRIFRRISLLLPPSSSPVSRFFGFFEKTSHKPPPAAESHVKKIARSHTRRGGEIKKRQHLVPPVINCYILVSRALGISAADSPPSSHHSLTCLSPSFSSPSRPTSSPPQCPHVCPLVPFLASLERSCVAASGSTACIASPCVLAARLPPAPRMCCTAGLPPCVGLPASRHPSVVRSSGGKQAQL